MTKGSKFYQRIMRQEVEKREEAEKREKDPVSFGISDFLGLILVLFLFLLFKFDLVVGFFDSILKILEVG
ncbi:hypothetical protein ACVRXF_10410 [Streptococcus orisasini]